MSASARELYDRLQVSPRARPEVIVAAYNALVNVHDPHGTRGDDPLIRDLNDAFDVLTDPASREVYDSAGANLNGTVVGEFRVVEAIAEGGFGRTYKGVHMFTGKPVCIKHCSRISPEDEAILINETNAMWDLRHFAIPAVRGLVRLDDGSLALIMSYISGPTLEEIIDSVGVLDAEHVCWIAERVLNALKYMHYFGVVHGDIKPQNIIVQPDSHMAVLVDFGLSAIKPTSMSDAKGYTPYFAPPEQMDGRPLLPESDLYSLGVTMIYALSGGNLETVMRRQVPDSIPDALRRFIRKLVVRDVLHRPRWPRQPSDVDLSDELRTVREDAFGRRRSGMKPIPGFPNHK